MKRLVVTFLGGFALSLVGWVPAHGATSVVIDGGYKYTVVRPASETRCPSGGGNECGTFQLTGLGPADYVYVYGPTFEPTGELGCFYVDGTFTITLESDASTVSGPLNGIFCAPGNSGPRQQGRPSYGNPQGENDTIAFSGGTGQFAGLCGTVAFSEFDAGAYLVGSVHGVLSQRWVSAPVVSPES
jgi:hypothetical protein